MPVYDDALLVGGTVAGLWLWAVIGPNAGVLYGKKTGDDLHRKKIKTKERQVERTERDGKHCGRSQIRQPIRARPSCSLFPSSDSLIPTAPSPHLPSSTSSSLFQAAPGPFSSAPTEVCPLLLLGTYLTRPAGKSTLLQILAGKRLVTTPGADIRVKGRDVFRDAPPGITFLGTEWSVYRLAPSVTTHASSKGYESCRQRRYRRLGILGLCWGLQTQGAPRSPC